MNEDVRPGGRDGAIIAAMESEFRADAEKNDDDHDIESFVQLPKMFRANQSWYDLVNEQLINDDAAGGVESVIKSVWGRASFDAHRSLPGLAPLKVQIHDGKSMASRLHRLARAKVDRERLEEVAVDPSWLDRVEDDSEKARVEVDVRYVMTRLERVYTRRQAKIWMESFNQDLDAKPVDYLIYRSVAEVIRAVEAVEQQAY